MEPDANKAPRNATDRNVETATGMWRGHITLPSSFLTMMLFLTNVGYVLTIHWMMDQQDQMRERIKAQEVLIVEAIKKLPLPTPPPNK
jgi:hypothetical protein